MNKDQAKRWVAWAMAGSSMATLAGCTQAPEKVQRPNILFIMTDDHAFQAISAYGDRLREIAPTPNIDRVAQQGMIFNRCLVTNSICGPSRATILTGKYSHLNRFVSNEAEDFDGTQQTFPKLLQQAGYSTAVIGKWHLGSQPTGFDYWDILPGQGSYYNPDFINQTGQYRADGYVTDIITDKTLSYLDQATKSGKPFMLMMHHKAPHREWHPNIKYINHFKGVEFPLPETLFDDYSGRGTAARAQDMTIDKTMRLAEDLKMWDDTVAMNWRQTLGRMTPEQLSAWNQVYDSINSDFKKRNPQGEELIKWKYNRYLSDYLACIKSVDESVGRVLDYLKANGLDKNTIVVYTSDQGFYLGEHGWFDKRFMYDESYRTPLLVSWPGVTQAGAQNSDLVSNLDFAETFLDAAGVAIPNDMQGKSLRPVLAGKTPSDWRKTHYYHYYEYPGYHSVKRHYGISNSRYKLMHFYYDIDEWEMYDLQSDPREMKNIYNDPAYADVQKMLHSQLDSARAASHDSEASAREFIKISTGEKR